MADFATDLIFGNPELAFAPKQVGINRPGYTRGRPPAPGVRLPSGQYQFTPPPVAFGPLAQERENQWYADNAVASANRIGAQKAAAQPNVGLQSVTPAQVPFEQAELSLIGQQADAAKAAGSGINDWGRIAANNKGLSDLYGQYHGGMSRGEYMQSAQSPLGATVYRAEPGTRDFTVNPVAAAMGGGDRMANQQRIVDAMLARGGTMTNSPSFANAVAANQEYQQQAGNEVQRNLGKSRIATEAGTLGLGRENLAFEREKFADPMQRRKAEAEISSLLSQGKVNEAMALTERMRADTEKGMMPSRIKTAESQAALTGAQAIGETERPKLAREQMASDERKAQLEKETRLAPLQDPNAIAIGYGGAGLVPPVRVKEQAGMPIAPEERFQSLGLPTEGLIPALQQIEQSGMPMTPEAEAALMQKFGPEIEQRLAPPASPWSLFTPAHLMQPTQAFRSHESISPASQMVRRLLGRNRPGVQVQKSKPGVQGAAPTATVYRGG